MELQRRGSGKAGPRPRPALRPGGLLPPRLTLRPRPAPFLPPPRSPPPSLGLLLLAPTRQPRGLLRLADGLEWRRETLDSSERSGGGREGKRLVN